MNMLARSPTDYVKGLIVVEVKEGEVVQNKKTGRITVVTNNHAARVGKTLYATRAACELLKVTPDRIGKAA